jgi:hypothetical protein
MYSTKSILTVIKYVIKQEIKCLYLMESTYCLLTLALRTVYVSLCALAR